MPSRAASSLIGGSAPMRCWKTYPCENRRPVKPAVSRSRWTGEAAPNPTNSARVPRSRSAGSTSVRAARRYHDAVSRGVTGDALAEFFTPDLVHHELPNALIPGGLVRDLEGILKAADRGRRVIERQSFEVLRVVAEGDRVALEVSWSGVLAVPLGDLPAGHTLRAHVATFLDVRDGRIAGQRNYDCYDPMKAV